MGSVQALSSLMSRRSKVVIRSRPKWLLFSGITKFVNSFDLRRFGVRGWGWVTAFGLLMAAAGFLSFMDPLAAAVTLSVLAGLFLMIQGVVSIAFGCLSGRFWM